MRLLCIRGENLASLYGPFELPLDESPFAEAGLFSVSGPTGSGKSTLMDALCLALYGRTPRLGERGRGVMIGREGDDEGLAVEASDVRNILSRGTGAGHAEVVFEADDGRRYRARWTVNRARGRAGGKLQAARMTLHDADSNDAITAGLTDVPARVKDLIGYSFEDFKRAVVLPQFEFTAFLRARSDERAVILERITGTEIYARLSRAAFARAKKEREELERRELEAGAVQLLSADDRAALAEAVRQQGEAAAAARAEAQAASEAVRWHEDDARLAEGVREAEEACAKAGADVERLAADRRELAEVERAQPLRPVRDEAARTAASRERATKALEDARLRLGEAETDAQACQAREEAARAMLGLAEERRVRERPALDEARGLDAELGSAGRAARGAKAEHEQAAADATAAVLAVEKTRRELARAEADRAAAEAWLTEHARFAPLAAEWPRWKAQLGDHAATLADFRRAEVARSAAREALAAAVTRRDDLGRRVDALRQDFDHRDAEARAAEAAARDDDPAALARVANAGAEKLKALEALSVLADKAAAARKDRDEAAAETAAHVTAAEEAEKAEAAARRRVSAVEASLEGARAARDRTKEALDLDGQREALVEGEPCPLCGATEHPYAKEAPTESAFRKQREAVADLEAALKEARSEATAAGVEATRHRTGAEKANASAQRHAKALEDAQERYTRARQKADLARTPALAADAGEKLASLVETAEREAKAARTAQDAAAARQKTLAEARRTLDEARRALEADRTQLQEATRAADRGEKDAQSVGEKVRALASQRDRLEDSLEPALAHRGDWRGAARAEPEVFAKACADDVGQYLERKEALDAAERRKAELGAELGVAQARAEEKAAQVGRAARQAQAAATSLATLQHRRDTLLGGRAVAEVETELDAAVKEAATALEAEKERCTKAEQSVAAGRQQVADRTTELEGADRAASTAAQAFASALAELGLEPARADALLARDAAWIAATRRAGAEADRASHENAARLKERQERRDEHTRTPPAASLDEARAKLAEAEAAATQAGAAAAAAGAKLEHDDGNRLRSEQLLARVEGQRKALERWARLDALIGSADGKRFRTFAQGLTLDGLLAHAGRHLQWLAPRYALQRVPGEDLELQVVDRDLGDEVRTLNGLSGGETFLVSLALALGLASLSTKKAQPRTLFIDEGFGTLDRDTLENAMVALESLRATGRTIGVISHVPELHERIGVRVAVERVSAGRSRVVLPEGRAAPAEGAARVAS